MNAPWPDHDCGTYYVPRPWFRRDPRTIKGNCSICGQPEGIAAPDGTTWADKILLACFAVAVAWAVAFLGLLIFLGAVNLPAFLGLEP